jgi:thymidine kinase
MSLEIVLGPMFAGKSSYILSSLRRYEAIGWPVLSITSTLDTRYETDAIHSHNHDSHSAISTDLLTPLLMTESFAEARLLVIEEAQFFKDLYPFVYQAVDVCGKDVLVVGLDGDSERRPFGRIAEIIPLCDKITKLTAMCKRCGNGTPAIFTHRKDADTSIIKVGEADTYEALCRRHYKALTQICSSSSGSTKDMIHNSSPPEQL